LAIDDEIATDAEQNGAGDGLERERADDLPEQDGEMLFAVLRGSVRDGGGLFGGEGAPGQGTEGDEMRRDLFQPGFHGEFGLGLFDGGGDGATAQDER
jgi:hypothetical protein